MTGEIVETVFVKPLTKLEEQVVGVLKFLKQNNPGADIVAMYRRRVGWIRKRTLLKAVKSLHRKGIVSLERVAGSKSYKIILKDG